MEEEPKQKRMKQQRFLNVAVAGCSHGEMDRIYSTLAQQERSRNIKYDLLICCGDYQALRNKADLHTIHVNQKYRQLGTFHQYYSGEKTAPVFTIFVGGNHEAASFLAELPNGGWVAPDIYYMGYSNVVKFAGLKIGGLSGIYKPNDYHRGHFERSPFTEPGAMVSAYHVRSLDIFRLLQYAARDEEPQLNSLDVMITHDWPVGITDYGDTEALLRYKPFFREDIERKALGNPETMKVLNKLKPRYWFSAHLHCRYEAQVFHENPSNSSDPVPEETKFLALGKPAPRQRYLETIQIPIADDTELDFEYDPRWCAVLRNTDHLLTMTPGRVYMPSPMGKDQWDFRPTEEQVQMVNKLFENNVKIPMNFKHTAPPHKPTDSPHEPCLYYLNPQSTDFCERLEITNFNKALYDKTTVGQGKPYYVLQNAIGGAEEIDIDALSDGNDDEFGDNLFVIDGEDNPDEAQPQNDQTEETQSSTPETKIEAEETITEAETYVPPMLGLGRTTVADRILKRRHVDIPDEES